MKSLAYVSVWLSALLCSISSGQDFSVICSVTKDVPTIPSIVLCQKELEVPKPVPEKDIYPVVESYSHIPSKANPSWNLLGSFKDARNKTKMVEHLFSHTNHKNKFAKNHLEQLTIGQLWYVHDMDHEGKKVSIKPKLVELKKSTPKPAVKIKKIQKQEPYCPPGSS